MLFRRKGWLRKEFNEKLMNQLAEVKDDWFQQKRLLEKSFDTPSDVIAQTMLAEAKHFRLFKEAKERKITLR